MCTSSASTAPPSMINNLTQALTTQSAASPNGPHAATRALMLAMLNRQRGVQAGGQLGTGAAGNQTLGAG